MCENKVHSLLSVFHIILDIHYFTVLVQKNDVVRYISHVKRFKKIKCLK